MSPSYGYRGGNPNYGGAALSAPGQNPRVIPGSGGQQTEDFYTYQVKVGTLAAGATFPISFNIQADSNFEWVMSTASGNLDGNTDDQNLDSITIPVLVSITDGGSGRILNSQPVPMSGICGTGKQPFILPVPRMFLAKSTVNLAFTSYSANQWDNIYMNFIGRKIFNLG